MSCGSSEAYVTVFKPASPGKDDGPRIWNDQLLQYASYNNKGDVVGDPKNVSVYYYMLSYFVIPYLYLVFLTIYIRIHSAEVHGNAHREIWLDGTSRRKARLT